MVRPIEVETRPGYRIWLRYSDGAAGEIDLSHVVGTGVFKAWENPDCFQSVQIDAHGAVVWNDDIDMCPYALYMELTGKSWEDLTAEAGVEG